MVRNFRGIEVVGGVVLAAVAVCGPAYAQDAAANPYIKPQVNVRQLPVNTGATALWETLQKLHTRASLLMIVAHPDDEDGGMLTYESRGMGVRTGMMTLTRGEGGQNVMTGDFNDALGLMRTQELLKEDEYDGVDQMFGTVADFGFSKTMEEALANWGYDRVLCDAVRAVRVYKPMVITSVFIGGVTDGHGQHQVSGRLAQEVFNAAGDASVCADQITKEGLQPWQPLKVYERVPSYSISDKGIYDYATGQYAPAKFYNYITKTWSTETPTTDVVIPEGTYAPLLGMSYLQWSRIGWGQQLSQYGGSALPAAGEADAGYHLYGSKVSATGEEKSFFDGIDTSLMGMSDDAGVKAKLAAIDADVTHAMAQFSIADTAKVAPVLADGLKKTNELVAEIQESHLSAAQKDDITHELRIKQAQFNDALVLALGLSMRAQVMSADGAMGATSRVRESADTSIAATQNEDLHVGVQVNNPSSITLTEKAVQLSSPIVQSGFVWDTFSCTHCKTGELTENKPSISTFSVKVPGNTPATRPYFNRPNLEQPYYNISIPSLSGLPTSPYPLVATATLDYDGVPITLGEVVQTAHHVTGYGTVYQPLVIVPAVSVALVPAASVIPLTAKTITLTATVRGDGPEGGAGTVRLKLPEGWSAEPASAAFHFMRRGEEMTVPFTVTPKNVAAQSYTISAVAHGDQPGGKTYTEGYTTISYAGLTPTNLYRSATTTLSGVDVRVAPGLRVAYVTGSGDEVPQSLKALGVDVHLLTVAELASADLSKYDEIVLGVRAYNVHPEIARLTAKLNAYAAAGGVVVVQYNTPPFTSTAEHPIAPYPFVLSFAENVVEEKTPVTVLLPEHPLMSWPNAITARDFDGWVEERGHSFLGSWDAHYDAPTETHDEGQAPQRGGLLYARTGCGAYVYVAYALYRQLPEGVPGAYRIFANLLSLPKNARAVGCPAK
jgi:LmbE family N-acetylglucosaminyl deacetylase